MRIQKTGCAEGLPNQEHMSMCKLGGQGRNLQVNRLRESAGHNVSHLHHLLQLLVQDLAHAAAAAAAKALLRRRAAKAALQTERRPSRCFRYALWPSSHARPFVSIVGQDCMG